MAPASGYCVQPFSFYQCHGNGFAGCCTTDPCALSWCPDFPEPSVKFPLQFPQVDTSTASPTPNPTKRMALPMMLSKSSSTPPSTIAETSESNDEPEETEIPPSTSTLVIVHETMRVVVSPSMEPTTRSMTLYSSPVHVDPVTVSSTLTSFRTHTRLMSPTTSQAVPAQATEDPAPIAPYASRHKWPIIGSTVGVFFGLGIAAALIVLCFNWERRRRWREVQARTMVDHPSMAGKDANQAGRFFGGYLNRTRGLIEQAPSWPVLIWQQVTSMENLQIPGSPYGVGMQQEARPRAVHGRQAQMHPLRI